MITSISIPVLCRYTTAQLNVFFPDEDIVDLMSEEKLVSEALRRIEYCFKHVNLKHYFNGNEVIFNHLFSDHYVMFLWFLSNVVYLKKGNCSLANKLYYLNKALHGLDCMYDTRLPNIFLFFHSSGTVLGKAKYNDFFVVLHGCTVGLQDEKYPVFSKGVSITANSSVIGDCLIGNRCTVSTRTTIFQRNIQDDHTAFINCDTGLLQIKRTKECYAQRFFNIDLKLI
jgi:serine O-acetyltransferase